VGWILPPDEPVVLVTETEAAARDAALRLAFVGLDQRVAGYLEAPDWSRTGLPSASLPQIDVATLRERLEAGRIQVVDVREPAERREGQIESAHGVSMKVLPQRWEEIPFPGDRELAVICGSGMRSSTAASVLLRHGFRNVVNVTGGMTAWRQAGYAVRA
jgi:hydroxyacylglutathione hydrolase